jgi:hypothetical protein
LEVVDNYFESRALQYNGIVDLISEIKLHQ